MAGGSGARGPAGLASLPAAELRPLGSCRQQLQVPSSPPLFPVEVLLAGGRERCPGRAFAEQGGSVTAAAAGSAGSVPRSYRCGGERSPGQSPGRIGARGTAVARYPAEKWKD